MYSPTQQFLIYSGLFFAVLVFSLLINSVFMRFARTLGMRDEDQALIRWSSTAKPSLGGICFYILFLACFSLHGLLFPGENTETLRPDLLGLMAATSLGFLMGLADDAYNTRPFLKFLIQLACGGILIATGSSIDLFASDWLNMLLTLLWVVGMMNSINMLDNMDGITTSVSIAILLAGAMSILVIGPLDAVYMVLIVGTMASLTGFLFFNWNPSRMFMATPAASSWACSWPSWASGSSGTHRASRAAGSRTGRWSPLWSSSCSRSWIPAWSPSTACSKGGPRSWAAATIPPTT